MSQETITTPGTIKAAFEPETGFLVGADSITICQFWDKHEEDFANAEANGRFTERAWNSYHEMLDALRAVIGHGYLEAHHPASQDYVAKSAIAKVRAAIAKATGDSSTTSAKD